MTLLGNEFHNEIVLGTKECKNEFVCAKGEGRQYVTLGVFLSVHATLMHCCFGDYDMR